MYLEHGPEHGPASKFQKLDSQHAYVTGALQNLLIGPCRNSTKVQLQS